MRRAVLGSTDGFSIKGLSQSHGQPVPEQTLRKAFREIDSDQDGLISVRALTRALRRCGVDASKKTVERILQDCGYDQKGELQVEQFIRFFRATERLVWSVDDEYNPVDSCLTHCGRFFLFLLLISILVLIVILFRIEPHTEIWLALLIALLAVIVGFFCLMIPVICVPLRRAMKLGQKRRQQEQQAIAAIRAREAKPQVAQRARTSEAPRSGLTWLEDVGGPPAIRGAKSEPQNVSLTQVEAYDPEHYRAAQDSAARAPRRGGLRPTAWAGAFSTEALEDEETRQRKQKTPAIWMPLPHEVPMQQPQLHSTVELLEAELQPRSWRGAPKKTRGQEPRGHEAKAAKKEQQTAELPSDLILTDCD